MAKMYYSVTKALLFKCFTAVCFKFSVTKMYVQFQLPYVKPSADARLNPSEYRVEQRVSAVCMNPQLLCQVIISCTASFVGLGNN